MQEQIQQGSVWFVCVCVSVSGAERRRKAHNKTHRPGLNQVQQGVDVAYMGLHVCVSVSCAGSDPLS